VREVNEDYLDRVTEVIDAPEYSGSYGPQTREEALRMGERDSASEHDELMPCSDHAEGAAAESASADAASVRGFPFHTFGPEGLTLDRGQLRRVHWASLSLDEFLQRARELSGTRF
jgi:hypothetical protein